MKSFAAVVSVGALHSHVRAWVAPVGLAGRAAQRAHLCGVVFAARQSAEDDPLRVAGEDARQPVTINGLDAAFVHVGVPYRST